MSGSARSITARRSGDSSSNPASTRAPRIGQPGAEHDGGAAGGGGIVTIGPDDIAPDSSSTTGHYLRERLAAVQV